MKLAAYLRCSSARQQEAFGPEVQRQAIRQWARANGHRIVSWHEDTISGTSELKDRAGWMQAEAAVKSGAAQGIVVPRLDRLARDVMIQELLLRKTPGVVLSARDSENELLTGTTNDPSRKLIRTILGAIAEYDREMITDRLVASRHAKAAAGGYAHGGLPYGFASKNGNLVPVAAEQRALALIRSLSAQGVGTREIARVLTAEGHPTKRGGEWCSSTVARILKRDQTRASEAA
ncbi:recombinase family protein [Williamsia deligens]|uniref:Recombinase family protein n=1 Tax=Williamsia deligens TaxID=321325 RepID=A0ABW3G760_9NOCA|nr:recombinase family protein [Williamsia deligens]MCP2192668.1 Site-specific DNA recombinase [Williamsia deligens]